MRFSELLIYVVGTDDWLLCMAVPTTEFSILH